MRHRNQSGETHQTHIENRISVFGISTFDTDYVLTKKENYQKALDILEMAGYEIIG